MLGTDPAHETVETDYAVEDSPMSNREQLLLNNALDALDRLFDRRSSVIDVQALFFATGEALRGTAHQSHFERSAAELLAVIRSCEAGQEERDRALAVTDELRLYLAKLTPEP